MRQIRLLVIAVGCLIGGCVMIYRYFSDLPRFDELTQVVGQVEYSTATRVTRRSRTEYLVLTLSDAPGRYAYLDWFPKADELTRLVRPGEHITLWTDAGRNNWVWQIEQDGRTVIGYDEIRDAVAENERFNLLFAAGAFAIAAFAAVMLVRDYRSPA